VTRHASSIAGVALGVVPDLTRVPGVVSLLAKSKRGNARYLFHVTSLTQFAQMSSKSLKHKNGGRVKLLAYFKKKHYSYSDYFQINIFASIANLPSLYFSNN
jgi:hypothetical protein